MTNKQQRESNTSKEYQAKKSTRLQLLQLEQLDGVSGGTSEWKYVNVRRYIEELH